MGYEAIETTEKESNETSKTKYKKDASNDLGALVLLIVIGLIVFFLTLQKIYLVEMNLELLKLRLRLMVRVPDSKAVMVSAVESNFVGTVYRSQVNSLPKWPYSAVLANCGLRSSRNSMMPFGVRS